jgi:hypothetical protein
MRERNVSRIGPAVAAVALSAAFAAAPNSPIATDAPRTDWNQAGLRIGISLVQTSFQDGTFGATETTGSATVNLPPDAAGVFYVGLGSFGPDGRPRAGDLCSGSVGSRPPGKDVDGPTPAMLASHPYVWWIVARPVPAEFGRVALDATWSRWEADRDGRPVRNEGETRKIAMEEGGVNALDWIKLPVAVTPECASDASIRIGASIPDDPSLAGTRLSYDLWFEHRVPGGEPVRRRFRGEGSPGQPVAFQMEPVRLASARDGQEVVLQVDGTLRARQLRDGTVMVELRSSRSLDLEKAGRRSSSNLGLGRGRKVFETSPGKTVSVVLPDPQQSEVPYAPSADALILTVDQPAR